MAASAGQIGTLGVEHILANSQERGHLTRKQIERTLKPVKVVETKQKMTYVPAHEVRAELTRTFGVGNWDSVIHDVTLLYEEQREGTTEATKGKMYWFAGYRVACTLRIRDYEGNPVAEFTEFHAEENAAQPNRGEAHALALTACGSYALRRAAIGLGDAFGLHLYNKGSLDPIVKGTLQITGDPEAPLYVAPAQGQRPSPEPPQGLPDETPAPTAEQAAAGQSAVAAAFAHPDARPAGA